MEVKPAHNLICKKINLLFEINPQSKEANEIFDKYLLSVAHLLQKGSYKDFMVIVNRIGILRMIESEFQKIQQKCKLYSLLPKLIQADDIINNITCCNNKQITLHELQYICKTCGMIHHEMDDIKMKHPSFDYIRYFRRWMAKLFNLTPPKIDVTDIINTLRKTKDLTINKVRDYLKSNGYRDLNAHYSYILYYSKAEEDRPQQFFDDVDLQRRELFFNDSMYIFDEVRVGVNRIYYGYIIYKLIEVLFSGEKAKWRFYIYLQSRVTIEKNDKIWKTICDRSNGEFIFKKTEI